MSLTTFLKTMNIVGMKHKVLENLFELDYLTESFHISYLIFKSYYFLC